MHIHGVVDAIQFDKTGKSYIEGYIGIIYSDWAQNQSMATNHKNKDEKTTPKDYHLVSRVT